MEGSNRPCVCHGPVRTIGVAKLLGLVYTDYVSWLLMAHYYSGAVG